MIGPNRLPKPNQAKPKNHGKSTATGNAPLPGEVPGGARRRLHAVWQAAVPVLDAAGQRLGPHCRVMKRDSAQQVVNTAAAKNPRPGNEPLAVAGCPGLNEKLALETKDIT